MSDNYARKFWCAVVWMLALTAPLCGAGADEPEYVTVAILAKDKAFILPTYLACLERQTWPAEKTCLYIRTNNNNDETAEILRDWLTRVRSNYAAVYFDDSDVEEPVQLYKPHEWNYMRFKVLGKIRQDSVDWARASNTHYFVADCDNMIVPETIERLLETHLPIVAPMLHCTENPYYSNYHYAIDENGYFKSSPFYYNVLWMDVKGLIEVPVVHCTYLIRHEALDKVLYDDGSGRYEYVIFSDSARQQQVPQYLDNRQVYGYVTFAETEEEVRKNDWLSQFE